MSAHTISLKSLEPQTKTAWGSRTQVTKKNFPILRGMSLYHLVIAEGCFREPHWHPNADELGYCTAGKALITIFSNGNQHDQFLVTRGEMFFIPSGSIHAIENAGQENCECILSFSSDAPEDFGLSGSVGCMALDVMGNTWGKKSSELGKITRSLDDVFFGKMTDTTTLAESAMFPNRWKFSIEESAPLIHTDDGFAKLARKETWPALRAQAMYSLWMQGSGMREPHWHPETAELGYVLQGRARMTVKSPGNAAETYELAPGDVYFIPQGYPHHIENVAEEELHFLIFFDTPHVQDIGYSGAIPAFPDRILAPTLQMNAAQLALIPKEPIDKAIVKKINENNSPALL